MEWNGAVTRDDIEDGETRGYLFGAGRFELPRGYMLGFQLQTASNRAYLLDYDISDADRLWSGITLEMGAPRPHGDGARRQLRIAARGEINSETRSLVRRMRCGSGAGHRPDRRHRQP